MKNISIYIYILVDRIKGCWILWYPTTHTHSLSLLLPMNASSIILHMRYFNWSFSQVFVLFVLDFLLLSHQFLICNYWKLVLNSFQISSVFHLSGFHHLFICLNIIQRRTNPCACVCVRCRRCWPLPAFMHWDACHSLHQARLSDTKSFR